MAVSVCWLPIIFNFNNLLGYIMAILSYTITPLSGPHFSPIELFHQ